MFKMAPADPAGFRNSRRETEPVVANETHVDAAAPGRVFVCLSKISRGIC
jgi:hypothetical protein